MHDDHYMPGLILVLAVIISLLSLSQLNTTDLMA